MATPENLLPDDKSRAEREVARHERKTLAGFYLESAVDELRASGSSDELYPSIHNGIRVGPPIGGVLGRRIAKRLRREATRSAVLFAMLAAEAYANQYLQIHLTDEEFSAADRLPTFEKFILGPRLVRGEDLLERGRAPAQTLKKLLAQRGPLVHPKLAPPGKDGPEYTPLEAAEFIVAVADAAGWLIANSDPRPEIDMTVMTVDQEHKYFLEFGHKATERLPESTDPPAPDLILAILTRRAGEQRDIR
jgi:hypothetical protein